MNTKIKTKIKTQLKPPPKPEIKRRSKWFETWLLILIAGFGILAFFSKQYSYFPFDLVITREIQLISLPFFRELMLFMTTIGYVLQGSILTIIGSIILVLWRKYIDAGILLASTLGAAILSGVLKFIVSRPRPDPTLIHQLATYKVHDSFPSGHVLFFIGFMGYFLYLSLIYLQRGIVQKIAVSVCAILIVLMGMSRIYLGAHWFSDTLGAYLIGSAWLLLVVWFRRHFIDFPTRKSQ